MLEEIWHLTWSGIIRNTFYENTRLRMWVRNCAYEQIIKSIWLNPTTYPQLS